MYACSVCVCVCEHVCVCMCVRVCWLVSVGVLVSAKQNEKSNTHQWEQPSNRQDQRLVKEVPDQAALAVIPLKQIMNFAINAVSDTLPHCPNLMKWKKISTESCHLCTERQIFSHVLNHCQVALDLQFDMILSSNIHITTVFQGYLPGSLYFIASLPDYTFTEHICLSLSSHVIAVLQYMASKSKSNLPSLEELASEAKRRKTILSNFSDTYTSIITTNLCELQSHKLNKHPDQVTWNKKKMSQQCVCVCVCVCVCLCCGCFI